MSGIWPFFNSSFSNASINKILAEIDADQQQREAQRKQLLSQRKSTQNAASSGSGAAGAGNGAAGGSSGGKKAAAGPSSMASLSHEVAYSPTTQQFSTTASQLLHSIKESDSIARGEPMESLVTQLKGGTAGGAAASSVTSSAAAGSAGVAAAGITKSLSPHLPIQDQPAAGAANATAAAAAATSPPTVAAVSPSQLPSDATGAGGDTFDEDDTATSAASSALPAASAEHPNVNIGLFNKLLDQPNLRDEINLSKNQRLINYISQVDVIDVMADYVLFSLDLAKKDEPSALDIQNDLFVDTDADDDSEIQQQQSQSQQQAAANNGTAADDDDESPPTPLEKALQRASVCSEVLILPNTNILPNLMASQALMTKLWRGFFDRDVKDFFHNSRLITPETLAEEEQEEEEEAAASAAAAANGTATGIPKNLYTPVADAPIPSEEEYERSRYKDSHSLLLLNNFLKLVDDMATMNMNELMNFIRFEQGHIPLTTQFVRFIPYSPTTCDLLVRLVSTDKPYNSNGLIDILIDQDLVLQLFKMAKIYYLDHQVQDNLCNLLNGIVGISSNVGFWDDPALASAQQLNEFGEPAADENGNVMRNSNPNVGPNDLTRQLVSKQCIMEMLDIIINYGNYGLVTVVSVIIEVIRKNNSDYDEFDWIGSVEEADEEMADADEEEAEEAHESDEAAQTEASAKDDSEGADDEGSAVADMTGATERSNIKHLPSSRDPIYLGGMLKLFSIHLDEIVENYLTDKYFEIRNVDKLSTATGDDIEPLGYERFKVMELLAELLHCSNMILMNKSLRLDFLIYKRDLWRDVKQTECLVQDALNDSINANAATSEAKEVDAEEEQDEEKAIENEAAALGKRIEGLEISSHSSSLPDEEQYIQIPSELSIGNYFKLQLLQTSAIPLIAIKMHRFPWNNFMHNVVFDLVQQIFNGRLANWDEDQASNVEETKYDDNLSLNKILIWSLFGDFDQYDSDYTPDETYPGFFDLPDYILYCFLLSKKKEEETNFKLGYMGHLTLIAEEVHKFQNYVENFGMARDDQTFSLLKEESDSSSVFYMKSSFYVFNTLYERVFESGRFDKWNEFVNTTLKELNSMYNKVLGNPNDLGAGEEEDNGQVTISDDGIPISQPPINKDAIILDDGDSEEFRNGDGAEVVEGEELEEAELEMDEEVREEESEGELMGTDLRPVKGHSMEDD